MKLLFDLEKLRYVVLKEWDDEKGSVAVNDLWAVNIGLQPGLKRCFSGARFLVDRLICMQKASHTPKFVRLKNPANLFFNPGAGCL